jgi:hypothetical protein
MMHSVKITFNDRGIDKYGRRSFFLDWIDDNGKRHGQVFLADPENYGFTMDGKPLPSSRNRHKLPRNRR